MINGDKAKGKTNCIQSSEGESKDKSNQGTKFDSLKVIK